MQEIRGVSNNVIFYYVRGGATNIQSLDNEVITLRCDKTRAYVDNNGNSFALTWDVVSGDVTKISYTIPNSNLVPNFWMNWEHIRYKNASLQYDEYYSAAGRNVHDHAVRWQSEDQLTVVAKILMQFMTWSNCLFSSGVLTT